MTNVFEWRDSLYERKNKSDEFLHFASDVEKTAGEVKHSLKYINWEIKAADYFIKNGITTVPEKIILVDGGFTDNTVIIASEYADEIIYDKALGLANARNIGLDHTSSKYIFYVGPDNIMLKG